MGLASDCYNPKTFTPTNSPLLSVNQVELQHLPLADRFKGVAVVGDFGLLRVFRPEDGHNVESGGLVEPKPNIRFIDRPIQRKNRPSARMVSSI